jgi:hypothetical protein
MNTDYDAIISYFFKAKVMIAYTDLHRLFVLICVHICVYQCKEEYSDYEICYSV